MIKKVYMEIEAYKRLLKSTDNVNCEILRFKKPDTPHVELKIKMVSVEKKYDFQREENKEKTD